MAWPVQFRLKPKGLFEKETTLSALKHAFLMLRPDVQWQNPVMFVVEVGAFLTLLYIIEAALGQAASEVPSAIYLGGRLAFLNGPVRQLCYGPGRGPG